LDTQTLGILCDDKLIKFDTLQHVYDCLEKPIFKRANSSMLENGEYIVIGPDGG